MCDFAVDFGAISANMAYGDAGGAGRRASPELDGARRATGVLTLDGRTSAADRQTGRPFMRLAAAAFDAYLHAGAARHSAAV